MTLVLSIDDSLNSTIWAGQDKLIICKIDTIHGVTRTGGKLHTVGFSKLFLLLISLCFFCNTRHGLNR